MLSRCWCPTAKNGRHSTLLGNELFLAELYVPNILIHYFGSTRYVASPVLSLNSRPKAKCTGRNLACTLCISGQALLLTLMRIVAQVPETSSEASLGVTLTLRSWQQSEGIFPKPQHRPCTPAMSPMPIHDPIDSVTTSPSLST